MTSSSELSPHANNHYKDTTAMSVGGELGLDDDSGLIDQVREAWRAWTREDPPLRVVDEFDDLRGWLRCAQRPAADELLLGLAMRAAPDGADDVLAAAALAKCLLPGASVLACELSTLPTWIVGRGRYQLQETSREENGVIDQLVAAQLWIECRSFPWRRRRWKVAANILAETRAGVRREMGDPSFVCRTDRTWVHCELVEEQTLVELVNLGDRVGTGRLRFRDELHPDDQPSSTAEAVEAIGAMAARRLPEPTSRSTAPEGVDSAAQELLELLDWACESHVICDTDRRLLMCLIQEADQIYTRNLGRGFYGLVGTELSKRVAPVLGVSGATVRRRTSRTVRALNATAPGKFCHEK